MNILITGGAGFIGSHVGDLAAANGHKVFSFDIQNPQYPNSNVTYIKGSILDAKAIQKCVKRARPDVIVHLAALISVGKSVADPLGTTDLNIKGLQNVVQAAIQFSVPRIVFASSAAIYGHPASLPVNESTSKRPLSPYGWSKLAGELYLEMAGRLYGLQYVNLRFSNVYGPRQDAFGEAGVVAIFADRFQSNQPINIDGDGNNTRDFIFVGDVAKAVVAACSRGKGAFCIGTGRYTTINQLYDTFVDVTGYSVPLTHGPARTGDIQHSYYDIQRSIDELGVNPRQQVRLERGLQALMQSLQP